MEELTFPYTTACSPNKIAFPGAEVNTLRYVDASSLTNRIEAKGTLADMAGYRIESQQRNTSMQNKEDGSQFYSKWPCTEVLFEKGSDEEGCQLISIGFGGGANRVALY
jgi:hypothetical protein